MKSLEIILMDKDNDWSKIIENKSSWRLLGIKELLHSRELLMRFVYRDFVTLYKQTVLGSHMVFYAASNYDAYVCVGIQ